jgi:hypothetical protein
MIKRLRPVHLLVFLLFAIMLVLAILSDGTPESGDSYQHYLISRYSFRHPWLLLDLWGKPVFTLLSAPFAAAGFLGINIFNILCAVLTAWLAYLTARKMNIRYALLGVFFAVFAPVYFICTISGLTEPLFGLILMASLYLLISDRAVSAALLVSFLPFVRSEGFPILVLFLIVLLVRKKWKAAPLLAAGTIIYSIIGYFFFGDIMWIINKHPYSGAADIYGYGDPLHFIRNYSNILGKPLCGLFLVGLISLAIRLARIRKKHPGPFFLEEIVIVTGTCVGYVLMHSLVLWKGFGMGSMGTIRVMAAIAPFAGLIALRGFEGCASIVSYHKIVVYPAAAGVLMWVWASPFSHYEIPVPRYGEEVQLAECAEWMKAQGLQDRKLVYFYPYLGYALDVDPFDYENKRGVLNDVALNTGPGSIIIWESHFGPNECGLPLETMKADSTLKELKMFRSPPWRDGEGKERFFEIYVFEKK